MKRTFSAESAPASDDRLVASDPRRARHEARVVLAKFDEDDPEPTKGTSMRSRHHTKKVEHPKGRQEETGRGRSKVWKDPFWKRRSAKRSNRAKAATAVSEQA